MIDYIIGFTFLPISLILFMNIFGWTNIDTIIEFRLF